MYKILPILGVDDEVADAAEWYENEQKGLGIKFIEDWESTVDYLAKNPFSFQKQRKQVRYAYLKKFPYLIVYEIDKLDIIIYGVIHAKQHPKKRRTKK